MDSISRFVSASVEVASDATIAVAQELFRGTGDLRVLTVVEGGRAIGVAGREAVVAARDLAAPVRQVMALQPLIIDSCAEPLEAARQLATRPEAEGYFLVCEDGRCVGAGSMADLLDGVAEARETGAATGASADKREFLELVTQELDRPVAGIAALAELLERQPLTADAQTHVRAIRQSGAAIKRVLAGAVDLTRAELGELEISEEPVLLRDLIDDIQAEWTEATDQGGVTLLASFDGDPDITALTDPLRLRQVFDCLIGVAMKFTRQGSVEVTLKAAMAGDQLRIEGRVRDTSRGFPPEHLARIFEPRQLSDGSGNLALPLARQLVLGLNGCIRAESNAGAGVTIVFDYICGVAEAAVQPSQAIAAGAAHVLVVDDNATNRMVAEALCEMFECTSECAEDGLEAVEIASNGRFDVILMDIKMPRMDGIAATRAIRALSGVAGQTPIIALTANVDPEDAQAYLACGMCSVVEKPIKPERLLQAINDALDSSRQRQSAAA